MPFYIFVVSAGICPLYEICHKSEGCFHLWYVYCCQNHSFNFSVNMRDESLTVSGQFSGWIVWVKKGESDDAK